MSNKGIPQSLETRRKIGLANTKDRTQKLIKVNEYITGLTPDSFPSLTDCAIYCGLSEVALSKWEATTEDNSEIRQSLGKIRTLQKSVLIRLGLAKKYDSGLTKFLLEVNHGMKSNPTELSQTNIFNISPDLLAEAIEISRKKK